jgi:hypothetical protein
MLKNKEPLRDDLIFGYVIDGEQHLHDYQKDYPHWVIQDTLRHKENSKD